MFRIIKRLDRRICVFARAYQGGWTNKLFSPWRSRTDWPEWDDRLLVAYDFYNRLFGILKRVDKSAALHWNHRR